MAIISFWSNSSKETGQTLSMVAIATNMAIQHNYKILIISTKYNDTTLEACYGAADNRKLVGKLIGTPMTNLDSGIEGLYKIANSGRMTPDIISNYTRVIYKNRLEVLHGYKDLDLGVSNKDEYLKIKSKYKDIIQAANKFYDLVFVDLDKGTQDEMVNQILDISDIVVYNVAQKMNMIEEFVKFKQSHEKSNYILNVGKYDSFSKYNLKNISRYVKLKSEICAVPYNTLFFEAADEKNISELFLKIMTIGDLDRNSNFVRELRETTEKIVYKLQELQMKM